MTFNTIEELQHKVCEKVFEVYDVFKNFFGEEFTDLQNIPSGNYFLPSGISLSNLSTTDISDAQIEGIRSRPPYVSIIVYWPRVAVTNENDRSIDIQDLYAKIQIDLNGRIPYESRGFLLNRSRYPMSQFMHGPDHHGYMHSHISRIPKHNFTEFQTPCLGRGPINGTIASLKNTCDEITWMLFCQELSLYVTVESLQGVPYNKLETVGNATLIHNLTDYTNNFSSTLYKEHIATFIRVLPGDSLKRFITYYLEHGHLSLCYRDDKFKVGMPFYDFIIDISNAFIEFFNENIEGVAVQDLLSNGIIRKTIVSDGNFYESAELGTREDVSGYIGRHVLTFKGRDIRLVIDEEESSTSCITTVLDCFLAQIILEKILKVVNYRYKNESRNSERGEEAPPAYQNVRYL